MLNSISSFTPTSCPYSVTSPSTASTPPTPSTASSTRCTSATSVRLCCSTVSRVLGEPSCFGRWRSVVHSFVTTLAPTPSPSPRPLLSSPHLSAGLLVPPINIDAFFYFPHIANLRGLWLGGSGYSSNNNLGQIHLDAIGTLSNLRSLVLIDTFTPSSLPLQLAPLSGLSNLEHLHLVQRFNAHAWQSGLDLSRFPKLCDIRLIQELYPGAPQFSHRNLRALTNLRTLMLVDGSTCNPNVLTTLTRLEQLGLVDISLPTLRATVRTLPRLTELVIYIFDDDGLDQGAPFAQALAALLPRVHIQVNQWTLTTRASATTSPPTTWRSPWSTWTTSVSARFQSASIDERIPLLNPQICVISSVA